MGILDAKKENMCHYWKAKCPVGIYIKKCGSLREYRFDSGIGNSYLPLSAEWHIGVDHGVGGGRKKLMAKLREIYVEPFVIKTAEEVKELKKIYPGHFRSFKKKRSEL